ncbi:MAG: VWA domain-containing protein [Deltaproteobacteria bacterium]|nr:VWA domain-containing protein [Deltaproteobacteria bacterium]
MSWGALSWMWALVAVAVLAVVAYASGRLHWRRLGRLFRGELLDRVLPYSVRVRRVSRDLLALAGLGCLVVALAEPLYGKEVRELKRKGVDIVIAVDLSRSMDARDVDPSRLERARREILDLIGMIESDRVGLVIFAGGAYPRMPLTQDYDALMMVVDELDTDMFRAQGSALGEGIRMGSKLLLAGDSHKAGKAIIVLSDGESHDAGDAVAAASEVAAEGVRVYAMGIGVESAPIPLNVGGWVTIRGKTVLTEPNPKLLRDVARASGGAYVHSVASAQDMESLYRDEIRKTLRAVEVGSREQEAWKSGFQWPLGLGLVLLLLSAWVGDGRRPWGGVGAVLLVALAVPGPAMAATLAEGDTLYRAERYVQAERVFTELSMERPTDPDVYRRLAATRYRMGDHEGAARAWDAEARLRGRGLGTRAIYDSGNAHYQAGRLEEAIRRYDQVLNVDSDHLGAGQNKDLALRELRARREDVEPPLQQPSPGASEGQEGEQQDQQQSSGTGEEEGEPGESKEGDAQQEGGSSEESASGESQDGEAQGAKGEPGSTEGGDPEGADAEGSRETAGEDGQELATGEASGVEDLEGLETGDDRGTPGQPFDGNWENDGPVTAAQADRLLEGVEEGRPRVRIPGRDQGRPW